MGSDVEVHDLPAVVQKDDETVQVAKRSGQNDKEIDGGNLAGVIAEEGLPGLGWKICYFNSVLSDCGFGDLKSEEANSLEEFLVASNSR